LAEWRGRATGAPPAVTWTLRGSPSRIHTGDTSARLWPDWRVVTWVIGAPARSRTSIQQGLEAETTTAVPAGTVYDKVPGVLEGGPTASVVVGPAAAVVGTATPVVVAGVAVPAVVAPGPADPGTEVTDADVALDRGGAEPDPDRLTAHAPAAPSRTTATAAGSHHRLHQGRRRLCFPLMAPLLPTRARRWLTVRRPAARRPARGSLAGP